MKPVPLPAHEGTQECSDSLVPMTAAHLDWVCGHERDLHVFPWTYGNFVDALEAGYVAMLYMHEGQPVAYAIMLLVLDEGHLLNVGVPRAWQNQGVARRFLTELFARVRRQGITQVFLEVRPSNLPARHLYEKMGFVSVGRRAHYYPAPGGGREDAIVMRLGW